MIYWLSSQVSAAAHPTVCVFAVLSQISVVLILTKKISVKFTASQLLVLIQNLVILKPHIWEYGGRLCRGWEGWSWTAAWFPWLQFIEAVPWNNLVHMASSSFLLLLDKRPVTGELPGEHFAVSTWNKLMCRLCSTHTTCVCPPSGVTSSSRLSLSSDMRRCHFAPVGQQPKVQHLVVFEEYHVLHPAVVHILVLPGTAWCGQLCLHVRVTLLNTMQ